MKAIYKQLVPIVLVSFVWLSFTSATRASDPVTQFKGHLNDTVELVHNAETAIQKRVILNDRLSAFIDATDQALSEEVLAEAVVASLESFKLHFEEKRNELNGEAGFTAIPDDQLNSFATFVQQDTEQAFFETPQDMVFGTLAIALIVILVIFFIQCGDAEAGDC